MTITSRPYQGEDDYSRMRRLVRAIYPRTASRLYCTVGDLDWWRFTADPASTAGSAQLWLADGELVAFTWPGRDQVDLIAHPAHEDLIDDMLAHAEQARRELDPAAASVDLLTWAYAGDEARSRVLERRGYDRTNVCLLFRRQSLSHDITEPTVPPGYLVRQLRNEGELEARVAVHRDAFAPSRMTAAKHRAVMAAPTYRQDLDLVVEAPDGSLAAFSIVWFDEVNGIGVFEPVGTHSAHRRLGLGAAVMREGMRRLQALGAHTAYVNTGGHTRAANALYEATGFELVDVNWMWKKAL